MEANKMKILSGTRSNFSLCSEYLRSLGFFVWLVGFVYSLHVFALAHCFANSFTGLAMLALGVLPLSKISQIQKCFQSLLPPDSCDNL